MENYTNNEITTYLTTCIDHSIQIARATAFDYYEKLALHLLTPAERNVELKRLAEMHRKEAETLDRPLYSTHANDLHFMLVYFTSGHNYFSTQEKEKYQQALIIHEMNRINQEKMAICEIEIDIQQMKEQCAKAREKGQQPDILLVNRLNYSIGRREALLLGYTPEAPPNKTKATCGPKKKYSFGFFGQLELFRQIVNDLDKGIGFLGVPTTTDEFIQVATSADLTREKTTVHMGCMNTQLIYILEYFKYFFTSFNPATISNSELFYSRGGTVFNNHNLNSTSSEHVHKWFVIDAIFKKHGIAKPNTLK